MKGLNIAFLWHMHQPFYRDPLSGSYSLPWVRLHGIKGYYDMVSILEDFPEIRATFNLVPSLLAQLTDYVRGEAIDLFLLHSEKEASDLTPEEKKILLMNFFMCNWETMVKPYPGYFRLLQKRGAAYTGEDLGETVKEFTVQDYRDLQVWFNLTWFGYRARKKHKEIGELIRKGRFFSEEEKRSILKVQQAVIEEVIPLYRRLTDRGQIELTTSPFYHPILPLLMDTDSARRSNPGVSLPERFHHPEDAVSQIQSAVAFHEGLFGKPPQGMWPSEGSVCPEMIPLLAKAGIRWIATDEEILLHSSPGRARQELFKPYVAPYGGETITVIFRDRGLSDLIGFTYAKNRPEDAAADLYHHLQNVAKVASKGQDEPLATIILDGENPWEAYPDGGETFLSEVYRKLLGDRSMHTVKVSDYLHDHPPRETIPHLYTGSWINHNFNIWIGSSEDNRAWNCLNGTRRFLSDYVGGREDLSLEKVRSAWDEIHVAEGSDWFWWYGDDFSSDNDIEFDRLFRLHLANVYRILGKEVPDHLGEPLIEDHAIRPAIEPTGFIHPVIDGKVTGFYEWYEAAYYGSRRIGGAMYRRECFFSGIFVGFDLTNLFIRLDPLFQPKSDEGHGIEVKLHITSPRELTIDFPLTVSEEEKASFRLHNGKKLFGQEPFGTYSSLAIGKIIELGVPFQDLDVKPGDQVRFAVAVRKGHIELERYPQSGFFSFAVPGKDFEKIMWST